MSPWPGKYYTVQEVRNFTDSPQVEVYGHNINVTRRAIQRRQDTVVARLDEEASRKRKRSSASRVTPAPAPAIPAPTPRAHKPVSLYLFLPLTMMKFDIQKYLL